MVINEIVSKRYLLESDFNEKLNQQEYMLKFSGDSEIMMIGAPSGKLRSRIAISIVGILLVTFCLITGNSDGRMNTTFVIGGSLLGLILTCTPFISFYSRKYFKINISRRLRQISINKRINAPDLRIDFSNIDGIQLKNLQVDDLISGTDGVDNISFMHTFNVMSNGKVIELFSLTSQDEAFYNFVEEFGDFLSSFIGKELKVIRA